MARISTKFLIATFVLALFLATVAVPAVAGCITGCKRFNEFCGGIAGFQCCKGLSCKLGGNFPDAGGVCVHPY